LLTCKSLVRCEYSGERLIDDQEPLLLRDARKEAEDFRDGPARVWKSRIKTAQPMQKKIADRHLLGNLGPVT